MPLLNITMERSCSVVIKDKIRRDLCADMAELVGVDPSFIAVLFRELPGEGMDGHGSFTEVYISEGRPPEFKDRLAAFVADDICRYTGWPREKANVIIHDIRRGSVAVSGHIVNRMGTAADTVLREWELRTDSELPG